MLETNARVLSCERMAQELVRIVLHAPEIAAQAKAGIAPSHQPDGV